MTFPDPILVATIAFAGVVVGAVLQSALARRLEKAKFVRDNQRSAYQDFLAALADLSMYAAGSIEHTKAKAVVAQARCRIALFGSKEVVQLLAHVFETSTSFEGPHDQHRLYKVILAMRRDSVGYRDYGIKIDLFSLVFSSAQENKK